MHGLCYLFSFHVVGGNYWISEEEETLKDALSWIAFNPKAQKFASPSMGEGLWWN